MLTLWSPRIVSARKHRGQWYIRIKWTGYDETTEETRAFLRGDGGASPEVLKEVEDAIHRARMDERLPHERDDDLPPPPVGSESTDDEDDEEALGNESSDQVMAVQSDATSQVNHLCLFLRSYLSL